jgi:SAM-dependent methyltransferase
MGETAKSYGRRIRENWFQAYCPFDQGGIDIGCHNDPVQPTFKLWDRSLGNGDATFMEGVPDNAFQTVYCSHILEHLDDPITALRNWYRITKPGGNLIVLVPHRDLYEEKKELPARFAPEHKRFYLPEQSESPCTYSFKGTILEAIPDANIIVFRVLDEGYKSNYPGHPEGEYSIEAIIKKPA